MFFRLSSLELAALVIGGALAAIAIGYLVGRSLRRRTADLHEPVGVVQTALLGFVGLILAFGLTLAVGRYENRRASVVEEANAIGTTYLRAQTLAEPMRSRSLELLTAYTDTSIRLAQAVPSSAAAKRALADGQSLQRELWALAGRSLAAAPTASAPRLYVETLNQMIDQQAVRKAVLNNRVPPAVLWFELASAHDRARVALVLPGTARPQRVGGAHRRRPCQLPAARHLRPRPAETWADHHSRHAVDRPARVDGPAPRSLCSLVGAGARTAALVPTHPERVVRPLWHRRTGPPILPDMPRSSPGRTRPAPSNVVEAMVRVPSPPPWAVSRTPLVNKLRATSTPLVMLVASAGYGKTTLAAQWAERERRPCAWLTAEESDDDAAVLLARLADALERIRPDDAPAVAPARRSKDWSTELQRLASRLSTLGDFVLVVDEVQLLRSRNATKVLATLAERVPAGSTLTLVGRLAPSLPIARLRADGSLLELRAADLALSRRESEALLHRLDAGLTDDEAAELLERCEGWAAGIRLSALAAGEHGGLDHALPGGDDRFLAEYFRSEFLSPLTDDLRTFLRRTSVLERLTAPVCDAVLKQKDSGRILASLERRHLLLAPLDRHGEAYRCHPLLRDLLARELGETEPTLVATLHRRAADWFEAHGDPESALAHAEGCGDVDRMARIVAAIALPTYYRGRIAEVEGWLERFDDESQLERYPAVAVLGGWIHALGGRPAAAERWLAAAERGAALETAPERRLGRAGHLDAARRALP